MNTTTKVPKRLRKPKNTVNKRLGKYELSESEQKAVLLDTIRNTEDIDEILELTHNSDPKIRLKAI